MMHKGSLRFRALRFARENVPLCIIARKRFARKRSARYRTPADWGDVWSWTCNVDCEQDRIVHCVLNEWTMTFIKCLSCCSIIVSGVWHTLLFKQALHVANSIIETRCYKVWVSLHIAGLRVTLTAFTASESSWKRICLVAAAAHSDYVSARYKYSYTYLLTYNHLFLCLPFGVTIESIWLKAVLFSRVVRISEILFGFGYKISESNPNGPKHDIRADGFPTETVCNLSLN